MDDTFTRRNSTINGDANLVDSNPGLSLSDRF